jgi:hypothetical protein
MEKEMDKAISFLQQLKSFIEANFIILNQT